MASSLNTLSLTAFTPVDDSMLPDPLPLRHQTASGGLISLPAGTDVNFARVDNGRYNCITAPYSLDQQARVVVKSGQRKSDITALVRIEYDKNAAAIAGIPQADKTAALWIGHSFDPAFFSEADLRNLLVVVVSGYQTQLARLFNLEK